MKIPRDQIKQFAIIDDNTVIDFVVESFEIGETQGGPQSKLPQGCKMYKTQLRVSAPQQYEGMMLFDNFVVGTAEDPSAEDPATWTAARAMGARRVNEFLGAIGVENDDDEEWADAAQEQQGSALVIVETPDSGKYKDVPQNRVRGYYALGQAPKAQTTAKGGVAAKPGAKPAAAQARPAQAQPAQAQVAKTATAAKPAARTVAQPSQQAARVGNGAAKPATTATTARKPATVSPRAQMIPCSICTERDVNGDGSDVLVTREDFGGHYQEHLNEEQGGAAVEE